ISQSKVPSPRADETAFPKGDVRYGEAFPTDTSLDASQDKENITKTYVMPHEALPRVTSLGGGKGNKDKSADKGSDGTDEMSHVLGTLRAVNILASGVLQEELLSSSPISVNIPPISKKDKGKGKMTEPE
nr:hypothetical protein [Tanacetum cinerariifolium]